MVTSQQISNWTPSSAAILEVSIDSEKISNPYLECLESHSRRTRIDSSSSYAKMISMPMSVRNPQETITQQNIQNKVPETDQAVLTMGEFWDSIFITVSLRKVNDIEDKKEQGWNSLRETQRQKQYKHKSNTNYWDKKYTKEIFFWNVKEDINRSLTGTE